MAGLCAFHNGLFILELIASKNIMKKITLKEHPDFLLCFA
jgi:hypothetical protein